MIIFSNVLLMIIVPFSFGCIPSLKLNSAEFNLSDGIHPNEKGTIIISKTLEKIIIKTYNKKN